MGERKRVRAQKMRDANLMDSQTNKQCKKTRLTLGRSGLECNFNTSRSNVSIPPNALPTNTPHRSGCTSVSGVSPNLASLSANRAAATAKCVNRSLLLAFLGLVKCSSGLNNSSGTSDPILHG